MNNKNLFSVLISYEVAKPQSGSNHWCSTEYNSNNAWNMNFTNGNYNNNNKYNRYVVRAVVACGDGSNSKSSQFLENKLRNYFFLP
jgi:hypothetical protein